MPPRNRSFRRASAFQDRDQVIEELKPRPRVNFVFDEWIKSVEISSPDLRNQFVVNVKFLDCLDLSSENESYRMFGRQTVGELADVIAYRLWLQDKLFSTTCDMDLFTEKGKLLSVNILMAELLKEAKKDGYGDGVYLTLQCKIQGGFWGSSYGY